MKAFVISRIKKWILFALIGCIAYFVGYAMGQNQLRSAKIEEVRKSIVIESHLEK